MLWEDIKWNETLLKQGVAFSNRPEIKLCKGTVLRARHVWGKWQKAEVKAKLILQRPEQLHFVLQKHAAVSTGRAWLVSDLQAADSLLHLPDPLRGQCGVWTMQRLSLTTSFLPGEALLPFHHFFFLVHWAEMCAESLRFLTGSLLSSDNDTWQVLPFAAINYT